MTLTRAGFRAIIPITIFALVGFESASGAAEEVHNPQRDIPAGIVESGMIAVGSYVLPMALLLIVLPSKSITGVGGFLDATRQAFTVYGTGANTAFRIATIMFILTLLNSGSAWVIAGDRVLAVAAADGSFFRPFGVFSMRAATPIGRICCPALSRQHLWLSPCYCSPAAAPPPSE